MNCPFLTNFLQLIRFHFPASDRIGQEIKLKIQPLQSNTEGSHSNLHRFLSESCGIMWMRKGY